jgi:O-antigen/teichoic acid export membrane protein
MELTLGKGTPANEAQRRYLAVVRGAASALANRALGLGVGVVMVPLTIGYLGAERYGAWATISSSLAWLYLADLGLANGLTNALSDAFGRGRRDLERRYLATAFWLLAVIGVVCGAAFLAIWLRLDWARLLNVHSTVARVEVGQAVALAVLLYLLGFPLAVVDRALTARREGALANVWSSAATAASFLAVVVVTHTRGGMGLLVLAISGSRLAVAAASAVWLFWRHDPELRPSVSAFDRASVRRLMHTGGLFFLVQIAGLILLNTDNVIIARLMGAERVTPYSVTWTLFTIPSMLISLVFPYLWPAYTEAIARGDVAWVKKTFNLSLAAGTVTALMLAVPLVALGRPIIAKWAGAVAVPPFALLVWMGAWSVIQASMNALACLLNAAGQLRGQVLYGSVTAAVNVWLSITWGSSYGITGVIAATVVSYLVCAVLPSSIETARTLARMQALARCEE